MFKRLTPQQRDALDTLRALGGEMVMSPQDARPLHALARRGLLRFANVEGVRVARLRVPSATRRRLRRLKHGTGLYEPLVNGGFIPMIETA